MSEEADRILTVLVRLSGLHVAHDLDPERERLTELLKICPFENLRQFAVSFCDYYDDTISQRRGCAEDSVIWRLFFDCFSDRVHGRLTELALNEEREKNQPRGFYALN